MPVEEFCHVPMRAGPDPHTQLCSTQAVVDTSKNGPAFKHVLGLAPFGRPILLSPSLGPCCLEPFSCNVVLDAFRAEHVDFCLHSHRAEINKIRVALHSTYAPSIKKNLHLRCHSTLVAILSRTHFQLHPPPVATQRQTFSPTSQQCQLEG